jgi:hypothetical protein
MKKQSGRTQVLLRCNDRTLAMLERLCDHFDNNRAVILRMGLKLLHDQTFPPQDGPEPLAASDTGNVGV